MTGRLFGQYSLLGLLLLMLAGCLPSGEMAARQFVVDWPEQNLVFIADTRIGHVQSFRTGTDSAPVLFAQTRGVQRASVRDIQLDTQRGQLWVLGDDGVYVHKARGLALQKRIPFDALGASTLRIEADRVVLLSDSGAQIGQIDRGSLVASWMQPVRRG